MLLVVLGTSLSAGCNDKAAADVGLRRALGGEPSSLDPANAADNFSSEVIRDLFEGLTTESPSGEVAPAAALGWSVDISGTEYTFRLRPSGRWSNGEPVQANDFVAAWRREVDPKTASPMADNLRLIGHAAAILEGKEPPTALAVAAVSDFVLVVKLERPAPYFPQILANPSMAPIYSKAPIGSHSPSQWVSNGPYVLEAWTPNTEIKLKANQNYWDRQDVKIEHVRYSFIADESTQYARYRAGELDMTDTVPANALPEVRSEHPHELVITPRLATAYYGFNLANSVVSSLQLRQALTMAINRPYLVRSLGLGQLPAYGFVPPGTASYTPQSWDWQSLSDDARIAEARRHYRQAGFSPASPLHLRLLLNNNEVIQRTAVLIAAMWKETLGVDVEFNSEEYKVFLESRHDTSRWDLVRLAWTADYNDAGNFLEILRTKSPNNDMNYTSPAMDEALDEAAQTADNNRRREDLLNAERLVLRDYPIIPLYFFVTKRLVKPYVHGVAITPLGSLPSKTLSITTGRNAM